MTSLRQIISAYQVGNASFRYFRGRTADTVVLIHGWGVRSNSMLALVLFLLRNGYSVLNYDYPTSREHVRRHAEIFLSEFRRIQVNGKLHFLTHSMGALVLRYAMAEMTDAECRKIDSIVMLGPPSRGSVLALPGKLPFVRTFNRSLGDMAHGADLLNIPSPPYLPPVGIIAGTRDGKVAFEDTALPDGLPFLRTSVVSTHPGLRDPARTGRLILQFFRTFQF